MYPIAYNTWHVISATDDLVPGKVEQTYLLGEPLQFVIDDTGKPTVWRVGPQAEPKNARAYVNTQLRYGYIWCVLGEPTKGIFEIPEYSEPDRRIMNALSVGINTSPPRAVENFLDMAHFPFVHDGILGEEPHTEVVEYQVDYNEEAGEIWATDCKFYQPKAAMASTEGVMADYIYRVPHPFCAVLYKSSPEDLERMDVISVFVTPLDEEHIKAHLAICILDTTTEFDKDIRLFQQTILGQDKPILENQMPRKLPLDVRAETPIRADKSSIIYRRYLRDIGLRFGTIPEAT
ncbi:MAG: (2Fe-2S)-binding protein [Blastopirellula sp.]|nr:MAG: (2Fe-2S)-binding protein [Blastopirellula sp.]